MPTVLATIRGRWWNPAWTPLLEMRPSLGACTQKWNFIYITDLAKAVRALLETPEAAFEGLGNPVFNVAGDDTRPLKEFVEEIHRLCKGGGNCLYGDRKENAEGGR